MENWFNNGEAGFVIYSWEHLLCVFLIFLVPVLMYIFRSNLKDRSLFKKVLIISLVLSESAYHFWALTNDMWTVKLYLPLQLCSLNVLLSIVLLLWDNKKLFAFVYLFGLMGALQAILTPDLYQQAWHFRFIHFFMAHGLIVWTSMYYAIVRRFRITWGNFFFSFIVLNVFAASVYMVNVLLNSNYMFLKSKPSNTSLMDYLGPYPWYILVLELTAFCLSFLAFLTVKEKSLKLIKIDRSDIKA